MTWFTLLASVLVLFAGRLAPLQFPQTIERTFLSLESHVQNETPAKIETPQQLRIGTDLPNQSHHHFAAVVPTLAYIPTAHPYRFDIAVPSTQVSRLLSLQPRTRSPPLQNA